MAHTSQLFKSACSYCGVGCGIEILKHRDGSLDLRGDHAHPANRGLLCSKGRSLLHTVRSIDSRLKFPLLRTNGPASPTVPVSWNESLRFIAGKFKQTIADHGPDSVAFYISGQCLTEEYYLANKLVKGFLRTNNIDTNSRLCMSSAVCGYKATLGSDAPPVCYDDIDSADTFLIAGANPAWCHPVLFRRIEARKNSADNTRVILVDPRRTASAEIADLHLQLLPGTDVPLFLGIARQLWKTGQINHQFIHAHVNGWDNYLESLAEWTLEKTAATCGLDPRDIALAAQWLSHDRRFLSMWTMGLNQSAVGTDKNIALISLSLITGKIGKPGCGPFSLTGQPNAMGGREVGGMATLLAAHHEISNSSHRAHVAAFWKSQPLSDQPGLTAVELFDALQQKKVKAVWIIATNPVASLPASWHVESALRNAELVVVQDIYPTETTDFAHVILPAAGWLEKTGTMTNSERRITLLEKAIDPPGQALPDTEILIRFAHEMGFASAFNYQSPAEIFAEHAALTAHTDIDITALSHQSLREQGPTQWPAPKTSSTSPLTSSRLYASALFSTPSGRANLLPLSFENRSELPSPAFPLILTTGRVRDHWHTMTKTGRVRKLSSHIDSPFCEIHPLDAAPRNIADGDILSVSSPRGSVQLRAVVTETIRPGVVFLPMHWGKKLAGDKGRANNLTSPRVDPVSKEPDLKFASVQITKHIPPRRRIVVVGGGAAALAFIEQHRRFNPHDSISLFSDEPHPIYNRVLLPHYIDGSKPFASLIRGDDEFFARHRVTFHRAAPIVRIDRSSKTVHERNHNRSHPYDFLVLATGSRPAIHFDGRLPDSGVLTLRSRADADRILIAAASAKSIVICGGGLLGLELADSLRTLGHPVTILQRSDRLMGKQLDTTAAAHLADELRDRGIHLLFNSALVEILGQQSVNALRLRSTLPQPSEPTTLPCDLLIFATGILPNKELAGAAGLNCDRGILINQHLLTSDPHIAAIGECAQLQDATFGTTPAANEQAAALAQFLRGNLHAPYLGTTTSNILKLHGLQLASAGIVDPDPQLNTDILTLHDPRKRFYQKLVIQDDRLIGALCLGDTSSFPEYLNLISSGLELDERRATLLRPGAAAAPLDGPLVCSCNHIGAGTIQKAIASCGTDLHKVCTASRAGISCGSCRPEVASLIRAHAAPAPLPTPSPAPHIEAVLTP